MEVLDTRIIVAGGGGGACGNRWSAGGLGGGLIGGAPEKIHDIQPDLLCPNQTSGYAKLNGQDAVDTNDTGSHTGEGDGGGGGGLWGGYANQIPVGTNNNGGSGGSSYISGYPGCIESSTPHIFTMTTMQQGVHEGDGLIIISKIISKSCTVITHFSLHLPLLFYVMFFS